MASAPSALARFEAEAAPGARRSVPIALAGSYRTSHLAPVVRLTALRRGIHVQLYEANFDTYAQKSLDPSGTVYVFDPDYVILAPHEGNVRFP